jgi:nicotinate dehydrogenase subunit A
VDVDPSTPLLYVLSDDLELRGPKFGCGLGLCGTCTVIVNGQAVRSCIMPVEKAARQAIITLEGLGTLERPHPIQQAFIDEQAMQCGYCLSGVIMTAKALLDRTPNATDAQISQAMSRVLCRCGAHVRMLDAIKRYAQTQRGIAASKDAALCPEGRCHLGDTNAPALSAEKTTSSALVSQRRTA